MGFRSLFAAGALAAALAAASSAQAALIDFDDLVGPDDNVQVADGYAGLDWGGFTLINAPPAVYAAGVHSGPNAIIQAVGGSFFGTADGADFTFASAWVTGTPLRATDTVYFLGFRDGVQVYNYSVDVLTTAPTLLNFDWNVDRITFDTGWDGGILDDITVTGLGPSPIPEPSTWALMLAGFAALGSALRQARRRQAVA